MKPTSRKPSPKATKCWANVLEKHSTSVHFSITAARNFASLCGGRTVPAWLLTQDQIPAVIEAMARAMRSAALGESTISKMLQKKNTVAPIYFSMASAALRAAGVGVK